MGRLDGSVGFFLFAVNPENQNQSYMGSKNITQFCPYVEGLGRILTVTRKMLAMWNI